ncbi:MAG: hypothetical protein R6U85_10035 [Salinivirgaceae bacterium]
MDTKKKAVSFKLLNVSTEQFALIEDCYQKDAAINVEANLRFAANDQARKVGVFALVKFNCAQKPFIIVEAGCHFEINPDSWSQMVNNNALLVPKSVMQHLAVITIGTVRGILHAKTENTPFNQYVLPTINVSEMIKDDVTFEFRK